MKSPLFKKGDVVQFKRPYGPIIYPSKPMIILGVGDRAIDKSFILYKILIGDRKGFIYERCLELVKT